MKASKSGQSASLTKNNGKYAAELLEFLLPYMKNRKRTGNTSANNQNTLPSTSSKSQSILPCTSTENQRNEILEETQHHENAQFIHSQNDDSNLTTEQPRQKKKRKVAD